MKINKYYFIYTLLVLLVFAMSCGRTIIPSRVKAKNAYHNIKNNINRNVETLVGNLGVSNLVNDKNELKLDNITNAFGDDSVDWEKVIEEIVDVEELANIFDDNNKNSKSSKDTSVYNIGLLQCINLFPDAIECNDMVKTFKPSLYVTKHDEKDSYTVELKVKNAKNQSEVVLTLKSSNNKIDVEMDLASLREMALSLYPEMPELRAFTKEQRQRLQKTNESLTMAGKLAFSIYQKDGNSSIILKIKQGLNISFTENNKLNTFTAMPGELKLTTNKKSSTMNIDANIGKTTLTLPHFVDENTQIKLALAGINFNGDYNFSKKDASSDSLAIKNFSLGNEASMIDLDLQREGQQTIKFYISDNKGNFGKISDLVYNTNTKECKNNHPWSLAMEYKNKVSSTCQGLEEASISLPNHFVIMSKVSDEDEFADEENLVAENLSVKPKSFDSKIDKILNSGKIELLKLIFSLKRPSSIMKQNLYLTSQLPTYFSGIQSLIAGNFAKKYKLLSDVSISENNAECNSDVLFIGNMLEGFQKDSQCQSTDYNGLKVLDGKLSIKSAGTITSDKSEQSNNSLEALKGECIYSPF